VSSYDPSFSLLQAWRNLIARQTSGARACKRDRGLAHIFTSHSSPFYDTLPKSR
jgi:hypothetical protein